MIAATYSERPPRFRAIEHCAVVRECGDVAAGILVDLSEQGFCVHSEHHLEVGERVELRVVGAGRISGVVRWLEHNRAGGVLEPFPRGAFGP